MVKILLLFLKKTRLSYNVLKINKKNILFILNIKIFYISSFCPFLLCLGKKINLYNILGTKIISKLYPFCP